MAQSDLDLLTGEEATELLATAVSTAGGELVDWSVRQVDHRPGRSTTVAYRARVRWGEGVEAGRVRTETLGASLGRPGDQQVPGVLTLDDGEHAVAVWRFPGDPALPALATAYDAEAVATLLGDLGVPEVARGPVTLRVRAYRPTRRAVIEASTPGARVFLKVVRPEKVDDLHARHALLAGAGLPVPKPLGRSADGLLVIAPLSGESMRHAVRDGGAVPSAAEVVTMLDRLPDSVAELPLRTSWSENAGHYASVIGAAMPAEADRARHLAETIATRIAGQRPDEPTHGDLYEAQVMLADGRITGLLDVDSAGPGRRADDLACLVAHIETLSLLRGWDNERLHALALEYAAGFAGQVEPVELSARIGGVLLSLATGPHRVQEADWPLQTSRRLDAVERWLGGVPG
ncbi:MULTISPECIES: phosphotransferase [Isoptericola]|uniref:Phosphotransferase n=1 Tax=Isoptericola sediminis TaxID=2733572 RepID=A0A849KAM5_9MICO|nr:MULTISPECIES: phosphotransferase [Isoptericola]MDO8145694.1 phosphotransferase [Isoptericola sp. 178]MDO8149751.1 phosphotransferase [Isoptericola sp. b515]NNU28845.1 phosphotransferase [Isoptericola sediminis]